MNKEELRIDIGVKIKMIRLLYRNDKGRPMNQAQFAILFNNTEPLDCVIDCHSLGKYERGSVAIPGDKLEKIYSLDKSGNR